MIVTSVRPHVGGFWIDAEVDGVVVGELLVDMPEGIVGWVEVIPEWRGRGVSDQLYRAAASEVRRRGLSELRSGSLNNWSIGIWRRFLDRGEAKLDPGDGDYLMNPGEDAEDDLHEEDLPDAEKPRRLFLPGTAPDKPPQETGGDLGEQRWESGMPLVALPSGAPATPVLPEGDPRWMPPKGRKLFDKTERLAHEVHEVTRDDPDWMYALALVRKHHYSHSLPNVQRAIIHAMYDSRRQDPLVGVAIYSIPGGSNKSIENVFPGGIGEALELSRFIPLSSVAYGGESWFLARSRELLLKAGLRGFTSFSDPHEWFGWGEIEPGRWGEHVVKPGHYGQIYQATGLAYLGAGKPEKFWFTPEWRLIPPYGLTKIRTGKSGWLHNVERLVELGAPRPRALKTGVHDEEELRAWLERSLPKIARQIRAPGKHKFAFTVDPKNEREIRRLRRSIMAVIRPWSPEPVVFPHPEGRPDVEGLPRYGREYPRKPEAPERGERIAKPWE